MFQRSALEPAYHQDGSVEYGILTYGVVAASLRASPCISFPRQERAHILIFDKTNTVRARSDVGECPEADVP